MKKHQIYSLVFLMDKINLSQCLYVSLFRIICPIDEGRHLLEPHNLAMVKLSV